MQAGCWWGDTTSSRPKVLSAGTTSIISVLVADRESKPEELARGVSCRQLCHQQQESEVLQGILQQLSGFNEVKRSQDSSVGTARVISYLWRCELCLCYCLHTFLFWCPVTQCAHWKKENYNYTHKSLWELRALLKPVFSSVLQCFLGSMKVFYFLLLLQHTDEMYSIFVFVFYRFPLQLLHTRKHFPIFPAL